MRYFKLKKIKNIETYVIPKKYKNSIVNFINNLKKRFNDSIHLLVLSGSGGMEDIINNFSDIDFLLVIDGSSKRIINEISKLVNESTIKIGVTIYSKYEFERGLVDTKTIYSLELLRKRILYPSILNYLLKFPVFSESYRKKLHRTILPNFIHNFRRDLYRKKIDIIKVTKDSYNIMKFILSINGDFTYSYKMTRDHFYNVFPNCPKIYDIRDLIKNKDYIKYKDQCFKFIDYFSSNILRTI